MTIQLVKATYIAGSLAAVGSQHTLSASLEADLVHIKAATWVDGAPDVTNRPSGWRDLVAPLTAAGVPASNAPTMTPFGSSGLNEEYAFAVGNYCFCQAFHVDHDVKPGGKAYVHVHWSTNGTQTATVKWELQISRARRATESFSAPVSYYVEEAAAGVAWHHHVTEVGDIDALTLIEPDELILVTVRRVTNGGTNNTNTVFGLTVDFHYETDRDMTPLKAAPFY